MPQMTQDRLALDRGSIRTIDPTSGHLHVTQTPITKANVCPYYGREIPDFQKLGLSPDQTYHLFRDPDELAKGASSFNGKPLMIVHKAQNAAGHDREVVVGSASNPVWDAPYIRADLAVWDGEAIKLIESDQQRELSCGYYYDADMTPGDSQGVRYDGVMRNIRGNHVALVEEGRAGPDVMVGDSALDPKPTSSRGAEMQFNTTKLSRPALLVGTALHTRLLPKMAADAKFDLTPIVAKVTKKSWKADAPKIKAALDKGLADKLAADADLEDVASIIEAIAPLVEAMPDETGIPGVDDEVDDLSMDDDAEGEQRLRAHLKAKGMADPDIEAACSAMKGGAALDAPPEGTPKPGEEKDTMTKAAMDAAIAAATAKTEAATIGRLRAIQVAEREVRPFIGELAVSQDTAAGTYKLALDHLQVDLTEVPPEAYGAVLRALPKPGEAKPKPARAALDSAAAKGFAERFPHANRLVR